ncbi:UvrD-helicase domain-containing protein [Streptomyces sp. NPDC051098]|uniref:UvrD-helicase domain-containing protein n=1 Tax=Streptomyces sp. NPDC051098 TaxID=3155411 RepID=UPI003416F211
MTRADTASALTRAQLTAAGTPRRRLYIEAAPGSGKTTVAAQRFGVQRFHGRDQRAVLAVSFTRSATAELRDRVLTRWGRAALDWPHRIVTLDTIVCDLLTHLLHTELVRWPAGHRQLTVLDQWRVLLSGTWTDKEPTVVLESGRVLARAARHAKKAHRPSTADVNAALAKGYCTHQNARHILESALSTTGVHDAVLARFAATARALIVDEVFDANALDLTLVRLATEAGLEVTLVGDPWQALYAWRGAVPEKVPNLVREADFVQRDLHTSFRWRSTHQARLADHLRTGQGLTLPQGQAKAVDVLIALQWKYLWEVDSDVLPLAFKSATGNVQEAACTLLLSEITQRAFAENATFHGDALTTLGIDHEAWKRLRPSLQSLVDGLAGASAIADIWASLNTVIARESNRPTPRRHSTHTERLENLRARLHSTSRLVPGLTAHQAKGREWDIVGVCLTGAEQQILRQGLRSDHEDHRKLYVALTRARDTTTVIPVDG